MLIIVGWLIGSRLVRMAKERITYPRTGYVEYQQPPRKTRPLAALVGAARDLARPAIGAALPIRRPEASHAALIPALQGVMGGVMLLYIGHRAGVVRYYALGALSAIFGLAISLGGFDETLGSAVYFAAIGVSLVVSGALTLVAYLRQTTPPTEG